jgi:hypothetical protein
MNLNFSLGRAAMRDQETHEAFMRRKAAQAEEQDDVRRWPFQKRYGDLCQWCGSIHTSKAERAQCMLDNCG